MSNNALDRIEEEFLGADLPLKEGALNPVFGKGNPEADIMFIGEAPGKQEDIEGKPFVGRAGQQLDGLLSSIGLTLDDVYIANVLKYRPPGNRDPKEDEIRQHSPYLVRQIEAIGPKVICTLGNFSTKFILAGCDVDGMKDVPGISRLHGEPREVSFDGREFVVVPLYHPAAMLYRPQLKDSMVEDFKVVSEIVDSGGEIPKKDKSLLDFQ